jgi:hypothetical protein
MEAAADDALALKQESNGEADAKNDGGVDDGIGPEGEKTRRCKNEVIKGERSQEGGYHAGAEAAEHGDEGNQDEADGERGAAQNVGMQAECGCDGGQDESGGVSHEREQTRELERTRGAAAWSAEKGWKHRWSRPSRRIA